MQRRILKSKTKQRPRRRNRFLTRQTLTVALLISFCSIALLASGLFSKTVQKAGAAAQSADISPEAMAQIAALLREKANRTQTEQKLDSQLVFELKMERGETIADGVQSLETDVQVSDDGKSVVDITASVSQGLLTQLEGQGAEIINTVPERNTIRAAVPVDSLEAIAALPAVKFVQPRQDAMTSGISRAPSDGTQDRKKSATAAELRISRANRVQQMLRATMQGGVGNVSGSIPPTGVGSQTTEGDATHRAFSARGTFHADGTGIKIGVLSDGVTNLAASQALGDLGPVTVLPGQAGSGDEGTAMLEIVHDIAPGAQLYFATAFTSITSFAQNIRNLRTAGCDIIIDDVFYFVETPFQDGQPAPTNTNGGAVIQAVNDVTAAGAMYFSSAGNSGNKNDGTAGVWEGDFVDGGPVVNPILAIEPGRLHSFGAQTFNVLNAVGSVNNLYWSDPLGASANDYDLFRLNAAGTVVQAASINNQDGTQDPYEQVSAGAAGARLVVVKFSGADRFLHLNTNRGRLSISTPGQTHGHSAAADAFSCAATPARLPFGAPPNPVGPFPNPFGPTNVTELFSSDGPRRVFYQGNGTAYSADLSSTGGLLRQKPDITAADGTAVTGVGGFPNPFYGTSAAAPHAGAIAALLKSANPLFTPAQIRAALLSSAIDIEAAGTDRDSGAGIVMAYNAFQALGVPGTADIEFGSVNANEDPGDGSGTIDAGEGARVDIELQNLGVADATNITATLTTSTPGVTVHIPDTSAYPDLTASGGSALNLTPYRFTLASNAPCPLVINFTLTVNYTGGPSPKVLHFTIQTGKTMSISSVLDGAAPALPPGFSSAITGTQLGRLNRFAPASSCGINKPNPGLFTAVGVRQFDAYTFTACSNSCVTISSTNTVNSINLFPVVYQGAFNPASLTTDYLADPGSSGPGIPFSFNAVAGQTYTIVIHEVNPASAIGVNYTLNISGCSVNCTTPNQVPVAKVKNVTVSADENCQANASIDDGSFDPDGNPVTITQSPAGPYPLGTTTVLLTITDSFGATAQASATVTVVDTTGPSVTGISASPDTLWTPNHQMVPVTISYGTSDNCAAVTCTLSVSSNEPVNGQGDGDSAPDWAIVDEHQVLLRSERSGNGNGRIYTVTIDCQDAAGNHTINTVTVKVPKSQGH